MGQEESQLVSKSDDDFNKNHRAPAKVLSQARSMIKTSIARNDATLLNDLLAEDMYDISQIDKEKWLHKAVIAGQFDIVRILVGYGISVNSQDKNGHTPLHVATDMKENEAVRAVKELTKCGAGLNNLGGKSCRKTPLHLAIEKESVVIVEALLQSGCDPDIISECDKGISPLLLAAKGNSPQIFELLLKHGANIHKCKVWKVTFNPPIDILTHRLNDKKMNTEKCLAMIKLLLQADHDLQTTLTLMPQGNHSRGTLQGSKLNAIKAVVRRLDTKSKPHALSFIRILLHNGYHPCGEEAMAFISTFDPVITSWLQAMVKYPKSLQDLAILVIRKSFRRNTLAGVEKLSVSSNFRNLILNAGGLETW